MLSASRGDLLHPLRLTTARCFVLQAEPFICGEVLTSTNNSGSCYALHRMTLFDILPLEISICSLMNTDCFAIGVISVSDASQLLKSEKSAAQLNQGKWSCTIHCLSRLLLLHMKEKYFSWWLRGMNVILLILPAICLRLICCGKKNDHLAQRHDELPATVNKYVHFSK